MPKQISLDNGLSYMSASEAMPIISQRHLWDAVVGVMHGPTREVVHAEVSPCTELEFLQRYLEAAPFDLVLG